MKRIKSNLVILGSFIFFLFTSAFTFTQSNSANVASSCETCTTSGNCIGASYCGWTICEPGASACDLDGTLCGECAC